MGHLRSALHPDGADVVQSTILDVAALGGELQALALEMLLLEHSHLRETEDTRHQVTRSMLAIQLYKGYPPLAFSIKQNCCSNVSVYLEERSHAHARVDQGLHHWGSCSSVHLYS